MQNVIGIIVSYVYVAMIIGIAQFVLKNREEESRKFIHILLANWWIIAMIFFDNAIWASIVPFTFIIINYISYKKDLIKAMERKTPDGLGTVYYAITLFILTIVTFGFLHNPAIGLCATFVMGYADGLAGLVGRKVKSKQYKIKDSKKSVAGSLTMLLVTFIILSLYMIITKVPFWPIKSIVISLMITVLEAVSIKGTDNLTVPLATCVLLLLI